MFHIVSPLTGSKATIITTDTHSSPNHAPVLIQAAPRLVNPIDLLIPHPSLSAPFSSQTIHANVFIRSRKNPRRTPSKKRASRKTAFIVLLVSLSTLADHRHRERLSKGLRYFSKKVCNKVQAKKITSYNEVATELVGEYTMEEKRNLQLSENELVSASPERTNRFQRALLSGLRAEEHPSTRLRCDQRSSRDEYHRQR